MFRRRTEPTSNRIAPRTSRNVRPGVETLGRRELLAAGVASVAYNNWGQLVITGSNADDRIEVVRNYNRGGAIEVRQQGAIETPGAYAWTDKVQVFPSTLTRIIFSGGDGNDWFRNSTDVSSAMEGGAGNDTLIGGSAADGVYGGPGNDRLDGGAGNDFLSGGSGSDVVHGGAGDDTLSTSPIDFSLAQAGPFWHLLPISTSFNLVYGPSGRNYDAHLDFDDYYGDDGSDSYVNFFGMDANQSDARMIDFVFGEISDIHLDAADLTPPSGRARAFFNDSLFFFFV